MRSTILELFWFFVFLSGLGTMIYGYFVFIAMPAAGFSLLLIGLAIIGFGFRRKNRKLNKLKNKALSGNKRKGRKGQNQVIQISNDISEKISIFRKLLATLLLITYFLLINIIAPDFKVIFGNDIGLFITVLVNFIIASFLSGITCKFFDTSMPLLFVILSTWAVIYFIIRTLGI